MSLFLRATLLAMVFAVVAVASSTVAKNDSGARKHGKVLRLVEHATSDTTTDTNTGPPDDSVGDIITFANAVFDGKDQTQVGTDQGFCLRTEVGKSFDCQWTTILKGGQIMVQGPFFDSKSSELAITGGTGRYTGVRGYMVLTTLEGGSKFRFEFHIRG
jgi:hypothetical protein